MTLTVEQAAQGGTALELPADAVAQRQVVPDEGALRGAVPTDLLVCRFDELINVNGTTFRALIQEEFGDGIMSAIDFSMDIQRESGPKGDRVHIVMSGKFQPDKTH